MKPHYTQDEANEILRRAVERLPMRDEMSHEQLESVAAELGITSEALLKAETDWEEEETEKSDRIAFTTARRRGFRRALTLYAVVNTLFFLLCLASGENDAISMAVALLVGSTIGIALRGAFVLRTSGEDFELRFTRWRIERRARELAVKELGRITPRRD